MRKTSKVPQEKTLETEHDAIPDKEDIDREGIKLVFGTEDIDSEEESDAYIDEYEGVAGLDEAVASDDGVEIRDNLGDED